MLRFLRQFGIELILVVALIISGVVVWHSSFGGQEEATSGNSFGVTEAELDLLCPFGNESCIDVRRADIDGDGANDLVSLVFDNSLTTGMCQTYVLFSTGEVSHEAFGFSSENTIASAASVNFSFLGFFNINGEPGMEIFAQIKIGDRWDTSIIQYSGNKSIANGKIAFSGC